MFLTHQVGDKLYFEIPAKELDKDMLLVGRYTRAAAANPTLPGGQFGEYGGDQFAERTLRWERERQPRDPALALVRHHGGHRRSRSTARCRRRTIAPIIAVFNVEAYGPRQRRR